MKRPGKLGEGQSLRASPITISTFLNNVRRHTVTERKSPLCTTVKQKLPYLATKMFSDAFKITDIDDVASEVDCRMITINEGDMDIGANPSAEEMEEAMEDGAKRP